MKQHGSLSMISRRLLILIICMVIGVSYLILYLRLSDEIEVLKKKIATNEKVLLNLRDQLVGRPSSKVKTYGGVDDGAVMIYNRVPKTGSTSFTNVAYSICKRNHFHVLHLNVTKNSHVLSLADQKRFIANVSLWSEKKPALYHGHSAFLDFSRFGVRKPMYINIIRDPLERLISYYYFMRFGDDYRPHLQRRRSHDKKSFDECVEENGRDCDPNNLLWMQVPFFCGHSAQCWVPGNRWALEQAKHNLINNYLLVGTTDHLRDFIAVLEAVAPRYFRGALEAFQAGNKSHLRRTVNKRMPSEKTVRVIKQSDSWKLEDEFYQFTKQNFLDVKQRLFIDEDSYKPRKQQFHYEKIRPR